ncbi:MAG: hypothetical protein ACREIU_12140, partial [Planctomycetota bacterium]
MPKSRVAFGLGALLLAAGFAGALLLGGSKPNLPAASETAAGARSVAAEEPQSPPVPSSPTGNSTEAPERSLPVPDFASKRTAT